MKTTRNIAIMILMFISQVIFSQSLLIRGYFVNSDEKAIQADYLLKSSEKVISYGIDKKIKIELELNKEYALTVSKEGYKSKTVHFSTYTIHYGKFSFDFEVILNEDENFETDLNSSFNYVFYDKKIKDFNYEIKNTKHQQN